MDRIIGKVVLTKSPLMEGNDFKLNRKKIGEKLDNGAIVPAEECSEEFEMNELTSKVAEIIAGVIGKRPEEVLPGADIFFDLGGSSLDYFTIVMDLQREFRVNFPSENDKSFKTAGEFAEYIEKHR